LQKGNYFKKAKGKTTLTVLPFAFLILFLPKYKISTMILRYLSILLTTFCLFSCKNEPKTPTSGATQQVLPLQETFAKKYPNVQDVVWDTLDNGFAALFSDDTYDYKAYFDDKGVYQYTATFIEQEALPKSIQAILIKKYPDANAAVIMRIEKDNTQAYHIELETSTDYVNLDFDSSGKLLTEDKHPLSNEEIQRQEEEGVDKNEK
jgi:hypothetical protein